MKLKTKEIRFDPIEHRYFLGDEEIPSVTKILQTVGLSKDFTNVDPFYRDRGIAGHKAIELYLKGELDESTIDPCLEGHWKGFLKFMKEVNPTPLCIEAIRYSEALGYAGTIDLIATDAIYDWKFSKSHDKVAELQGQAYKILYGANMPFKVVQFPGDGTYEITDYGNNTDLWDSVMNLYKWKTKRRTKS